MTHDTELSEAARTMAQVGASKGGKARAAALSPERRTEIARKAAAARWGRVKAKLAEEPPEPAEEPARSAETAVEPLDWEAFRRGLAVRFARR